MKLLRYCILLFLIASFLYGCTMYKNIEAEDSNKESQDDSETSELPDVGENLEYIENI